MNKAKMFGIVALTSAIASFIISYSISNAYTRGMINGYTDGYKDHSKLVRESLQRLSENTSLQTSNFLDRIAPSNSLTRLEEITTIKSFEEMRDRLANSVIREDAYRKLIKQQNDFFSGVATTIP